MDSRTLRENATEFINYKRSIGYAYEAQEYLLAVPDGSCPPGIQQIPAGTRI